MTAFGINTDIKSFEVTSSSSWIQTHWGEKFDFLQPVRAYYMDVAHALSNICRYNGHTRKFYSVAEHSYWVSIYVPQKYALIGLLHDAHEAYVGDVTTPLKRLIPDYQKMEQIAWECVSKSFGIPVELPQEVKDIDLRIVQNERKLLLGKSPAPWVDMIENAEALPNLKIECWHPELAKKMFLERFFDLGGKQH